MDARTSSMGETSVRASFAASSMSASVMARSLSSASVFGMRTGVGATAPNASFHYPPERATVAQMVERSTSLRRATLVKIPLRFLS